MATGKKFYWLKLHKDFFKRHDIRVIESMENGKDYILFYLKLLVESVSHEGTLRFSETIPYDDKMLATITNTNIDIVRTAIKVFTELNLMEVWDDKTIYLKETAKMLGFETDWARQKRTQRQPLINENVEIVHSLSTVSPQLVHQEIELDIEIEKEKEKDIDKEVVINNYSSTAPTKNKKSEFDFEKIKDYWNDNSKLAKIKFLSDTRKTHIRLRIDETDLKTFYEMIDLVSNSNFLRGENKNGWKATFDWCINKSNYIKILEGNFVNDNRNKQTKSGRPDVKTAWLNDFIKEVEGE